jgi:uncharacterized protein YdeI (YjbR/CyaY-like superfamily)
MGVAAYPSVEPKTVVAWRRWLERNHATARGVWFVTARRVTGPAPVPYEEAVEEALCHGWIDGQYRPIDDAHAALLFTPRRPGSAWARSNRDRVARLIKDGRMRPAGLAKVEAAKKDGSWSLLESVEALAVPPDLRRALRAARATARFTALSPSAKRAHLFALVTAKRPETRTRRIAAIVASLR